jgi:hypothetical protein
VQGAVGPIADEIVEVLDRQGELISWGWFAEYPGSKGEVKLAE